MVQELLLRILLAPFSLLYGLGVSLRNLTYRLGMVRPVRFDLPVVSVGNLSVGGTGKTPHIEYLIVLLGDYLELAVLSRGYQRKTHGFHYVQRSSTARDVGDEPLQFKLKYPDITVAVSESRSLAIPQMVMDQPGLQLILLDDAFQHRSVEPALHIMLTEYARLFTRDFLLPSGRLREWRSAYLRAHQIIVTKCPDELTPQEAEQIRKEIDPAPHQEVYFSKFRYGTPYRLFGPQERLPLTSSVNVLLISAIANTDYLMDYLENRVGMLDGMPFEDHHYFTPNEMDQMLLRFNQLPDDQPRIILSTEKDATRLALHAHWLQKHQLPVFILPVAVEFLFDQGPAFNEKMKAFLLAFES
ncbi:MAG: tetraacyldisaccharide 4'-kinase [Saprospiraceae bacterium]|nr:tetraacyldisaccharide 4'-kinase [Saprospiraceae bacterium]